MNSSSTKPKQRGTPISVPVPGSVLPSEGSSRPASHKATRSPWTPGRNTLDSSQIGRRNPRRSSDGSGISTGNFYGSTPSLSAFSAGVSHQRYQYSPRLSVGEDLSQHRNANNRSPRTAYIAARNTRSKAKQDGNTTIEISDSEPEEGQLDESPRRRLTPTQKDERGAIDGSRTDGSQSPLKPTEERNQQTRALEESLESRRGDDIPQQTTKRTFVIAATGDDEKLNHRLRMKDRFGNRPSETDTHRKPPLDSELMQSSFKREKTLKLAEKVDDVPVEIPLIGLCFLEVLGLNRDHEPSIILNPSAKSIRAKWKMSDGTKQELYFDLNEAVACAYSTAKQEGVNHLVKIDVHTRGRFSDRLYTALENGKMGTLPKQELTEVVMTVDPTVTEWTEFVKKLLKVHSSTRILTEHFQTMANGRVHKTKAEPTPRALPPARPKARPSASSSARKASPLRETSKSLSDEDNKQKLIWPFEKSGTVTLYQSDIKKLEPGDFLNDSIIEFGLKYLLDLVKQQDPDLYAQIYVFSSFFYKHLTSCARSKSGREEGFAKVRKWTSKVDIFKKKYIVVPINEHVHWYLAIIINPLFAIPEQQREEYQRRGKSAQLDGASESENGWDEFSTPPLEDSDAGRRRASTERDDAESDVEKPTSDGIIIPLNDRRSATTMPSADGIHNLGRGILEGGAGLRRGAGSLITPGNSFADDGDEVIHTGSRSSERLSGRRSSPLRLRSSYLEPRRGRSAGRSQDKFETLDDNLEPVRSQDVKEKWRKTLEEGAAVCVFDSLGGRHAYVKTTLADYLRLEMNDKFGIEVEATTVEYIDVAMPKQPNFCDCGVYLLHAFQRFFADPPLFVREVIPERNKDHEAWQSDELDDRRTWWKNVVNELSKEWEEKRAARETNDIKRALAAIDDGPESKRPKRTESTPPRAKPMEFCETQANFGAEAAGESFTSTARESPDSASQ